jgi:hypothetical protein
LTTVMPPVLGVTPTVTITSPIASASISSNAVQVEGTFTGPSNTGITVAGVPATIIGDRFISEPLVLDTGASTVAVRATTMDGLSGAAQVAVTVSAPPAQDFKISVPSKVGFAPFKFKPVLSLSDISDIQSVAIDFNGDGTNDYTGTIGNVPIHTYSTPGVYRVRVVITTSSQTYTRFRTVAVPSLPETRARACTVYAHLKARLRVNDSAGALLAFTKPLQPQYQELFVALGTNRPLFADKLPIIANGVFSPIDAEIVLVREVGTQLRGAMMHLVRMGDGVWRIDSL